MHVLLFFDHPPTNGYVNEIILLLSYLSKVWNSYILLTTHPPQWHNIICERPLSSLLENGLVELLICNQLIFKFSEVIKWFDFSNQM